MNYPKDISDKIESDYGSRSSEVTSVIDAAILKADYLNIDRTIRCILFLADKDIEKLKKYIEAATKDPRDVMYWAEYINHDQFDKIKRIRDFSRAFEDAETDVQE